VRPPPQIYALSLRRSSDLLQSFILTTMRQLTHADGASLWLKMEEDGVPKLFLASSQNYSIDKNTYEAFTVPVNEKTVVDGHGERDRKSTRLNSSHVSISYA